MPSKNEILRHLTHEELLDVAMLSSVEVSIGDLAVDRGSRKTVIYQTMKRYSLDRLKDLCRDVGVDASGDDKARLVERLIWTGTVPSIGDGKSAPGDAAATQRRGRGRRRGGLVEAAPGREPFRIDFPNVTGFSITKELVRCDVDKVEPLTIEAIYPKADVAWDARGWVVAAGDDKSLKTERLSRKAFHEKFPVDSSVHWLAEYIATILAGYRTRLPNAPTSTKRLKAPRALFPEVREIVDDYVHRRIKKASPRVRLEDIALQCYRDAIVDRLVRAIEIDEEAGEPLLIPILSEQRPVLSSADVSFVTKKPIYETIKSEVSHVVLDGKGDTSAPYCLEACPKVEAYVKNDQPHFGIQYEWNGETRRYFPDYLMSIEHATWIVELERPPAEDDAARRLATAKWIRALNNVGRFGFWKHVLCRNADALRQLVAAPAPPIEQDGSEEVSGRPERPQRDREWWELTRGRDGSRRRRRGQNRFHLSAQIRWFIALPSEKEEEKPGEQVWMVPCRCSSPNCDGVRTVSRSDDGAASVQFIGMHWRDFIEMAERKEGLFGLPMSTAPASEEPEPRASPRKGRAPSRSPAARAPTRPTRPRKR
jgi:hypothetical protein